MIAQQRFWFSGSHREIQNDKFGREPLHSTRHSTTPTTRRRSEQFAGWSENNFCQVDRKEHWKNCRFAWSKDDTEQSTVWSYLKFLDFDMLSATVLQNHQTHNCNSGFICSNSKLNKNVHKNRKMAFHIFPAATCNNNSTNKKPQRSIAIHRLLTFSFAACGNTTGPWRRRSKGGKTRGREVGNIDSKVPGWEGIWTRSRLCFSSPLVGVSANIQPLQKHPPKFRLKKNPVTVESTCHHAVWFVFPSGVGLHHVFSRDDEDGTKHDG